MKAKRRFLAAALAAVLAFGMTPAVLYASDTVSAAPVAVTVYVDGVAVEFPAFDISGRHYFSIADVAYTLRGTEAQFAYMLNFVRDFDAEGHPILLDDRGNYVIFNINLNRGRVHEPTGYEFARHEEGSRSAIRANRNFTVSRAGEWVGHFIHNVTSYQVDGIFNMTLMDLGRLLDFGISANSEDGVYEIDTSRGYLVPEVVRAVLEFAVAIDNRANWSSRAGHPDFGPGNFTIRNSDGSILLSYAIDFPSGLAHEYMNVFFTFVDVDYDSIPEIFVHLSAEGLDHNGNFILFELPVFAFVYSDGEFTQRHLPEPGIANNAFDTIFFTDRLGRLIAFNWSWDVRFSGYHHIAIEDNDIIMTPILTRFIEREVVDGRWVSNFYIYNHQTGETTRSSNYVWPTSQVHHDVVVDSEENVHAFLPHLPTMPDEPLTRVIPFNFLSELVQQAVQPTIN